MYQDYVRSGDARPMQSVIYHNLIDVLSMVTLAAHLCETFAQPETAELPCDDLISLAKMVRQPRQSRSGGRRVCVRIGGGAAANGSRGDP